MQLKSITLKNFQAHKDLEVVFAPGITTIKGPTDAGKSAVLRALRWVCLNDVAGADFIREGAKQVTVTLCLRNGDEMEITRSKKADATGNFYALDAQEFKAFGQSVPPDIARALALNEINFQGQHDAPFWFSDTAGEVSRQLNAVIDLSIIDTALANIASAVRLAAERKSFCGERLAKAKQELEALEPQKDRVAKFKTLKERRRLLDESRIDHNRLEDLLEQIGANKANTLHEQAMEGYKLIEVMLAARRAERAAFSLAQIIQSAAIAGRLAQPPPDFLTVRKAWSEWIAVDDHHKELAELVRLVVAANFENNINRKQAHETEAQFHAQIKGKRCPLCQNLIG